MSVAPWKSCSLTVSATRFARRSTSLSNPGIVSLRVWIAAPKLPLKPMSAVMSLPSWSNTCTCAAPRFRPIGKTNAPTSSGAPESLTMLSVPSCCSSARNPINPDNSVNTCERRVSTLAFVAPGPDVRRLAKRGGFAEQTVDVGDDRVQVPYRYWSVGGPTQRIRTAKGARQAVRRVENSGPQREILGCNRERRHRPNRSCRCSDPGCCRRRAEMSVPICSIQLRGLLEERAGLIGEQDLGFEQLVAQASRPAALRLRDQCVVLCGVTIGASETRWRAYPGVAALGDVALNDAERFGEAR